MPIIDGTTSFVTMRSPVGMEVAMIFRAHNRRCAVDIAAWQLSLPESVVLSQLCDVGFQLLDVDVVRIAMDAVGRSRYARGALLSDAPHIVDCSSFVKWLYAQRGVWVPRRAIQQVSVGVSVADEDLRPGDLVFSRPYLCAPIGPEETRVSHVGIVGDDALVIHASPEVPGGIGRIRLADMRSWRSWFGGRRVLPIDRRVYTLVCPPSFEIETSEDIRWIVLERMDWK